MATRKQIEKAYGKVCRSVNSLSRALISAQRNGMESPNIEQGTSPFKDLWTISDKVDKLFEKPIARAVMDDIKYRRKR